MFQSTPSLRSATAGGHECGTGEIVSIHALLAECDGTAKRTSKRQKKFQSTHSLRSATKVFRPVGGKNPVSIHALLAECDSNAQGVTEANKKFQSTHSLRSATLPAWRLSPKPPVSIHALLAECDRLPNPGRQRDQSFNPRTPCGVRRIPLSLPWLEDWFQSTHSLRSATFNQKERTKTVNVSIHALLAECDIYNGEQPSPMGGWRKTPVALLIISAIAAPESHSHECVD